MRLKRVTAFVLSALLILLNMTNIAMATEQTSTIKVGIEEEIGIVKTDYDPDKNMSVADSSIATLVHKLDPKDNIWKVMVKGLKAGKTTASIQLWNETSPKTYNIEVIEGSVVPPITNGIQKINANNLVWTPVSDENQLGGADEFSGIFFNEFKNFNESGGAIAARRISDVKISTFDEKLVGGINQFGDIAIPKFNVGLIAQESIGGSSNIVISNGDAVVGTNVDTKKLDMKVGGIYKKQAEIDNFLDVAKKDLVKLNNDLWSKEKTAEAVYDSDTITLNLVKGINVFEVDFSSGRKDIKFNYVDADAKDSTIIIKVKGSVVNYNSTFLNNELFSLKNTDNLANRVIWTFDPSIKGKDIDIELKNTILCGFLLAPNANIAFTSGYCAINGNIIANGLDASNGSTNSELHWVGSFMGRLGNKPVSNTGSLQFNKNDNHGEAVKGAEFALYQGDTAKYTTSSSDIGLVEFKGIAPGTYILEETKAPNRYVKSSSQVEVIVSTEGVVTFKEDGVAKTETDLDLLYINNVGTTNFSFKKIDTVTTAGIPDVEFKLMKNNNQIALSASNKDGIVSFSNIEWGSYSLVETTPVGYKAAGPWTVDVIENGASINGTKLIQIENEKISDNAGEFKFNKRDNHNKVVKNAEFALLQNGVEKYDAISGDSGLVSFNNIKQGNYILKETSAPYGYEISKTEVEVYVDSSGKVTFKENEKDKTLADLDLLYINNVSKSDFSFDKVLKGTKTGIPNVEFKLIQNDKKVATAVSDEKGVVSFKNIELGSYTLEETRPFGYQEAKPWTINVTNEGAFIGETKLNKIENVQVIGTFKFNKSDNHGNAVKEAKFILFQNQVEKYNATSTDKGLVSFNNIKEGTYTLKETSAPYGYEKSNQEVVVTVSKEGTVTLRQGINENINLDSLFINNVSTADFSFSKVISGTDTGIPNVEFKLMKGSEEVKTAVSDENGVVSFKNIELGTYRLVETTPTGFIAVGPWTIDVTKEGAFIDGTKLMQIENEKIIEKAGSFQFDKKDNYGKAVNGAKFALYLGDTVKHMSTSTDKGLVSFSNIGEGTYILKETSAPDGYEISRSEVEATVKSDGTVTFKESGVVKTIDDLESLYINKMILGSISFTKYINDKKGTLAGAEFELLSNGERYSGAVFSDANGLVTFLDVKPGEYKIREISSHSNYFKTSDKVVDVVIDSKGVSSLVGQSKIEAETLFINKVENSIQFIKYSDNKSVLSNATFELLKATEVISTSISDKNGVVRFDNILPGEYIVREKSAPSGYIKSDATRKLVVKDNGEILITASKIKEWEEAFKNTVYKSGVDSINDSNDKSKNEVKNKVEVPQTSDKTDVIFPLLAAILSLSGIVFMKKVKH